MDKQEGKVVVNGKEAATAVDFKAPEVASITPQSSKVFDVKFSEDVNAGLAQVLSNYSMVETGTANVVNLTGATVKVIDGSDDTVRITLPTALTKDKKYTVTVKGMQDVSANKNTMVGSSSASFTAVKDEIKPTLVGAKAVDADKIELTMSKELTSTAVTAVLKKVNADGTTTVVPGVTVTNNTSDVTKLTATIGNSTNYLENGADYIIEVTGGSDIEGNVIAADQKAEFKGLRDVTAPTVANTSFAENKLVVKFSEKMDTTNLEDETKYFVFNSATGAALASSAYTATKNKDNDTVTLTFNQGVLNNSANYTVRIDGQKDAAIIANDLKANTTVSFVTPAAAPTTAKLVGAVAGTNGKSVVLTLSGTISKEEAEKLSNYTIVDPKDASKTLAVTAVKYDSATQVTLTTAAQVEGTNNYKVTVKNFENLSDVAADTTATFSGVDKVAPTLTSIEKLGLSAVDLVFDEEMAADQSTGVVVQVVEKGTANVVATNALGATSGQDKKVRVNFTAPLTAGKTYTISITGAKDAATPTNPAEIQTMDFTAAADTTAPSVTDVKSTNAATVEITFDEEVVKTGTLSGMNFILKKGNETITWGAGTTFKVDPTNKKKVTIVNGGNTPVALLANGESYTVTVNDDGAANANYLADVAGNKVNDSSYTFKGVKDIVKPTVVSAAMDSTDDTKLVVKFSEKVKSSGFYADNYVVTNAKTGVPIAVTGETIKDAASDEVTLTLASSTVKGTEYRVYVANANGALTDLAVTGNLIDTDSATALFTGIDTVAPVVASATKKLTSAGSMTLTFGEKLDPTSVTAADFDVDGAVVTKAVVQENGTDVVLTFTGNEDTAFNPTVKLKAGAKIADLAGNEATGTTSTGTTIAGAYTDAAKPVLKTFKVTDTNKVTLTFSETLGAINESVPANIKDIVAIDGYTVSNVDTTAGQNTVVLTTSATIAGTPTITLKESQTAIKDQATGNANLYAGGDIKVLVRDQASIDTAKVAVAKGNLSLGDISAVVADMTLPTTQNHATVTWSSNKTGVIANNGTVTRPANGDGDATVKLTATIKVGEKTDTKEFTVTVKETPATEVAFSGVTANGTTNSVTTTVLTLTFDVNPGTLAASDITVTGATKGELTGTGTTRTLAISDITVADGENVKVELANPAGFAITPSSKDVAVNVAP